MDKRQLIGELKRNPKNVRFRKLCKIAEAFDFRFRGGNGSHHIYVREGLEEMLNFQNVGGESKTLSSKKAYKDH